MVESIFRAIDHQAVDFVVVSGDYIYVSGTDPPRAAAQMDTFLTARRHLSARTPVRYVLGNHEDRNIPTFQAKLSSEVNDAFVEWEPVDGLALRLARLAARPIFVYSSSPSDETPREGIPR